MKRIKFEKPYKYMVKEICNMGYRETVERIFLTTRQRGFLFFNSIKDSYIESDCACEVTLYDKNYKIIVRYTHEKKK